MDISQRYAQVLQELAKDARGLQRYTDDEMTYLAQALEYNTQEVEAVLCLITHSAFPHQIFEKPLISFLQNTSRSGAHIVYALNAARKHIIQARFKAGQRLENDFLSVLRSLLYHQDLAVVEWSLRTIEESGTQAVIFSSDLAKIRPSIFSLWRAQSRTILELVTLLQRRWQPQH